MRTLFLILCASCSLFAQGTNSADLQKCGRFVQSFYDWYVPKSRTEGSVNPALKERSSSFSPEIVSALREDAKAAAKVHDEIVGLDFDPFLNTQDPAERYVVGKIIPKGETYWVEVHGVLSGKKSAQPDVVPEMMLKGGRWVFVNFHYPDVERPEDANLLSLLKSLREERLKHPR